MCLKNHSNSKHSVPFIANKSLESGAMTRILCIVSQRVILHIPWCVHRDTCNRKYETYNSRCLGVRGGGGRGRGVSVVKRSDLAGEISHRQVGVDNYIAICS